MRNQNKIAMLDLETTSEDPNKCGIIQLACLIVDPRTFEPYNDGVFNTLVRPNEVTITEKALEITRRTMEEINAAPQEKIVWASFVNFMCKFAKGKTEWDMPIMAGHNIANFDRIIINRMTEKYKSKALFHPVYMIDTMQLSWYWFESREDIEKYGLDYWRHKLNLSAESTNKSHDALQDCHDTLDLFRRYMKLSRMAAPKLQLGR